MTFISYAQNFEDVMLFRALRGIERGTYIDIGAQDPVKHSVTKAFYERGWSGVNVDPARHWIEQLSIERPHDVNLCVAASDHAGELRFFNIKDTGLSTTEADYAKRHAEAGFEVTEEVVPCITLDQICAQQSIERVHFLKIDCEGAEESVLRGFSLTQVRPWIILVEATEPLSTSPAYTHWEPLVLERGYHFVYADGLNRFYVADEHRELDAAFANPPNVFDDFLRVSEYELLLGQHAAQTARDAAVNWQRMSDYLQSENERREAALVAYRQHIELLNAEHLGVVAARDHSLAGQAEELRHLHASLELQQRHAQEHVAELQRQAGEQAEEIRRQAAERMDEVQRQATEYAHEMQRQAAELERELQWREEHLATADVNLRVAQTSLSVYERELSQVTAERNRIQQELQQIHDTTSWRVTAPMRAAKKMLVHNGGVSGLARRAITLPLRWCKPMLQALAQNERLRRPLVAAIGRDSALVNRFRTFLFGQAIGHPLAAPLAGLEATLSTMGWESQRAYREMNPLQGDAADSSRYR